MSGGRDTPRRRRQCLISKRTRTTTTTRDLRAAGRDWGHTRAQNPGTGIWPKGLVFRLPIRRSRRRRRPTVSGGGHTDGTGARRRTRGRGGGGRRRRGDARTGVYLGGIRPCALRNPNYSVHTWGGGPRVRERRRAERALLQQHSGTVVNITHTHTHHIIGTII